MVKKSFLQALASIVFALASHTASAAPAAVPHWQVLPDKSTIEWTTLYSGKPVKGSFPEFTADITFDPAHLDASTASVKVAVAKVKSEDDQAQDALPSADWFSAAEYPLAVFEATSFKHVKDDQYEAAGTLTMHNTTVKITLPFKAKFYESNDTSPPTHYARIEGETTLKRLEFGVGQGDWAKTDAVADAVKVTIHIEAKQAP